MNFPQDEREANAAGYKGSWANGWGSNQPEEVKNCNHDYKNGKRSKDLNNRGTLKIYFCDVCKYYYLVDSSD